MLDQYCTELENNLFSFNREQSSSFAKDVANDFNPLHDINAQKFCVPGDLLFARILLFEGLYEKMTVHFSGMVGDGVPLHIVTGRNDDKIICDLNKKEYLRIEHAGKRNMDQALIEKLVRAYVAFSGENFPNVFVGMMKDKNAMINVKRPLVIYNSMSVHLDSVDLKELEVEASGAVFTVDGKRGHVKLSFIFKDQGSVVGKGFKTMTLANLREYNQDDIDWLVAKYYRHRAEYAAEKASS